jgi:hypothetical protein
MPLFLYLFTRKGRYDQEWSVWEKPNVNTQYLYIVRYNWLSYV